MGAEFAPIFIFGSFFFEATAGDFNSNLQSTVRISCTTSSTASRRHSHRVQT